MNDQNNQFEKYLDKLFEMMGEGKNYKTLEYLSCVSYLTALIEFLSFLIPLLYIKYNLTSKKDFEERLNRILSVFKERCLESYNEILEKEL